MAVMTRGDIVTEGLLIAGRDDLSIRANVWLQMWLDSVAASWPWPQLLNQRSSLSLPAGTSLLEVGAGSGGISNAVLRILDNIWVYTADKRQRGRVRLKQRVSEPAVIHDTTTQTGLPSECVVSQNGTHGQWQLLFRLTPDRDYLVVLDTIEQQAPLANDAAIPWYPNDATMVALVAAEAMRYDDGPESEAFQAQSAVLASMMASDKMRFGSYPGVHDLMQLDPSVFR